MNSFIDNQEILEILSKSQKIKEEQDDIALDKDMEEPVVKKQDSIIPSVGLNGIQISENGQLTKTKFFEMLKYDETKYSDITFTPEEAKRVSLSLRHLSTGINAAVPLTCSGSLCPFASTCPYVEIDKAPVGRACLVEGQLINFWTEKFMTEFDVDPNDLTEVQLVSELAEFNIYELRVTKHLAEKNKNLMQLVVTGVDNHGEIIENEEISRAFDLKERLKRNRMKVLEALMATRKEKVKLKAETNSGTSTAAQLSELNKKLREFQENKVKDMEPIEGTVVE
jgi:hypothetical protein